MTRARLVGLCLAFLSAAPVAAAAQTASSLQHQIAREGADGVVHRLTASGGQRWEAVLRHVETGQEPWLRVALALKPGTDAGPAEALTASVAAALLNNPTNVLRLMVPAYALDRLCAVPLIEPTPAQLAAYRAKAMAALDAVTAPQLAPRARQCSEMLRR